MAAAGGAENRRVSLGARDEEGSVEVLVAGVDVCLLCQQDLDDLTWRLLHLLSTHFTSSQPPRDPLRPPSVAACPCPCWRR
eukprot:767692-Hanusia_phi.AAC.1